MFEKSALLNLATIEARNLCFAVADAIHDNSVSYGAFVDLMAEKNVAVEVLTRLEAERDLSDRMDKIREYLDARGAFLNAQGMDAVDDSRERLLAACKALAPADAKSFVNDLHAELVAYDAAPFASAPQTPADPVAECIALREAYIADAIDGAKFDACLDAYCELTEAQRDDFDVRVYGAAGEGTVRYLWTCRQAESDPVGDAIALRNTWLATTQQDDDGAEMDANLRAWDAYMEGFDRLSWEQREDFNNRTQDGMRPVQSAPVETPPLAGTPYDPADPRSRSSGTPQHAAELPTGDDFLARVYATRDLADAVMDECLDVRNEGILSPADIVQALRDMADGIEDAESELAFKRDAAERLDDEWNATQAAATAAMNRLDEQREIVTDLGEARLQLRLEGNFAAADAVKAKLWEMGWECQDHGNYKSHMTRRAA